MSLSIRWRMIFVLFTLVVALGCDDEHVARDPPEPGIYHLLDRVDAFSLEISADGTFRWGINGCDFWFHSAGVWKQSRAGLIITPPTGEDALDWPVGYSFRKEVTRVELYVGADGVLVASGSGTDGRFQQRWGHGGVCAECGTLGPSNVGLCQDPLLGAEWFGWPSAMTDLAGSELACRGVSFCHHGAGGHAIAVIGGVGGGPRSGQAGFAA
jgi:hypothetical protein